MSRVGKEGGEKKKKNRSLRPAVGWSDTSPAAAVPAFRSEWERRWKAPGAPLHLSIDFRDKKRTNAPIHDEQFTGGARRFI